VKFSFSPTIFLARQPLCNEDSGIDKLSKAGNKWEVMMGVMLGHIDATPIFYGILMFLGLWSMWHKITHWHILSFAIEVAVFVLVFRLHGGTMSGGFAAVICALLSGIIFHRTLRNKRH
jgi:hypothetical protein